MGLTRINQTALPSGSILQAKHITLTASTVNNTATTVGTLSITPKSANSKLLVFGGLAMHPNQSSSSQYWHCTLRRDSTDSVTFANATGYNTGNGERAYFGFQEMYDSNSTSETTFDLRGTQSGGSTGSITMAHGGVGTINILEIAD